MTTSAVPEPSSDHASQRAPRRVFIAYGEVPALLLGAWRGEPVGLRRILGARRTGRIGIALAVIPFVAATAPRHWAPLLAWHAAASAYAWHRFGRPVGLTPRTHQRLLLWLLPLPLALAAVLRSILADSWIWPMAATLAAQITLAVHLRRDAPFGVSAAPAHPNSGNVTKPSS